MIPIYIPSIARASEAALSEGPMNWLPKDADVNYIVRAEEAEDYRALGVNVIIEPPEVNNIAKARWYAGWLANERGHDKFIMMDDDIELLIRKTDDDWRLRAADGGEAQMLLDTIEWHLDNGYGHIGVSARQGNNRVGNGGPPLRSENTRIMQLLAYNTKEFLSVQHGRLTVMEDFDVTLQLLRKGIKNCCFYYWAVGQKMTNAPGGCSTYRTHEVHEASAKALAEFHPGFVSLRQKQNKTDREGFGTRTEVTIQWKKAYASSQKEG